MHGVYRQCSHSAHVLHSIAPATGQLHVQTPNRLSRITHYTHMSTVPAANDDRFTPESPVAITPRLYGQAHALVIADANPWVRSELVLGIFPHLQGQAPREARSPSEVLARISEPACKVLVIDPCMPTIGQSDGIPLLRRICCLRRDLLILVLAEDPQRLLQDRALPGRIEHVHAKTVSRAWLWRFITPALSRDAAGVTPLAQDAAP